MNNNEKKKNKAVIIAAIGVVIAFCLIIGIVVLVKKYNDKNKAGSKGETTADVTPKATDESAQKIDIDPSDYNDTIEFEGEKYMYNTDLINILFLGVDKKGELVEHITPTYGGQADVVMLLSLNRSTKQCAILQISRNAMMEIEQMDSAGNVTGKMFGQLCLQYAYGNGKETSCLAMKRRVKELLYDTVIDGYITIDIDAIPILNDAVGGVEITVPEDYTWIDPSFKKGETVLLDGVHAEKYVRSRDINITGSNNDRMHRQVQYIPAMITKVRKKLGGTGLYDRFYPLIKNYLVTDLSADRIDQLADYNLSTDEIYFVPGNEQEIDGHDQFFVENYELQKILLKMLYKKK